MLIFTTLDASCSGYNHFMLPMRSSHCILQKAASLQMHNPAITQVKEEPHSPVYVESSPASSDTIDPNNDGSVQ